MKLINKFSLILVFFILIFVLLGGSSSVLAVTTTVDDIPGAAIALPDPAAGLSCTSSITRTINVAPSFIISDLNVGLSVGHDRRSDVRATLQSPSGTLVILIPGSGLGSPTIGSPDNYDNYSLFLDDTATNTLYDNSNDSAAGGPHFNRSAQPYELLSAFKGEDAQGDWILSICDTRNGSQSDAGTPEQYNRAQLVFTSPDPNVVTGNVFTDFNDNGVRGAGDLPVSGVLATAYDATGATVDSDTTNSSGVYSLSIPNGTQVRIEFSNIPSGLEPGAFGVDSGTTVQFVTSPAAGVDLGLSQPSDYCNNNPFLVMPCYINGDPLVAGSVASQTALVSIPYDAYGIYDATIEEPLASYAQVGSTWGLAYQRSTATVFSAALAKRHSGLGPLGAGGIYAINVNPLTGAVISVSNYLDITTLAIPVGALPSNAARGLTGTSTTPNTDPTAWDAVGKAAIGDIDIGSDDDELWFVNLANQTLYTIDIASSTLTHTTPISLPAAATACPASDIRPWAVEIHNDEVYVGVVCSAESTQNVNNLRAYIIRTSETTPGAFSLVFEFALNYSRGVVSNTDAGYPAEWRPWSPTMTSLCRGSVGDPCNTNNDLAFDKQIIYPQPILSDIEFDTNGDLIIGLMDRLGHQAGNANYATSNPWGATTWYDKDNNYAPVAVNIPANPGSLYEAVAASDILRACLSGVTYTLENNATCGSITTGGAGSAPAQGPGGGEYYWQDMYPVSTNINGGTHNEVTVGGLVLIPGTDEIAVSMFDPFNIRSGGIGWFSNTTGTRTRGYEIFPQDFGSGATTFGKAIGIGDVEGFCFSAPIEIGNRVWSETDNDGIQEPGETPLAGVTVQLYQGGTLIATAITDSNGNYFFSSFPSGTSTTSHIYNITQLDPNSNYEIRIPNITGGSQQAPLAGLNLSPANNAGAEDQRDSDGTTNGVNAVISVTTGNAGQNNHTYDFGFSTPPTEFSLGNRVWYDTNNNGIIDFGTPEVGIDGVLVELYQDTNLDGVYDAGDTFLSSITTASGGYYRFDNLPPGEYIVVLPDDNFRDVVGDTVPGNPLAGYWSSNTSISSAGVISDSTSNDVDIDVDDSDENGISNFTGNVLNYVASNAVTLGPTANEPLNETDLSGGQGEPDAQANMTVDFGFYQAQIGDLVFVDLDNNGAFNGADTPLASALVQLYASNATGITVVEIITGADGIPGTADDGFGPDGVAGGGDDGTGGVLTTGTGLYSFSGLPEGDYVVRVTPPSQYTSTVDTADNADTLNPDVNTNNNDNGIGINGGQVTSGVLTLTAGEVAPNITVNQSNGTTSDPSIDFGFVLGYSLGNRVWYDTDNDSLIDIGTEVGISGVRVELYQDDGDGVFDAGDTFLSFDTTDADGYYRFDGLAAGNYVVVIADDNFRNLGGGDSVAGDPLSGYWSSGTSINNSAVPSDSTANDADVDADDSDDNGITTFTGNTINYVAAAAVTLGPGNSEPLNETDLEASGQGADDNRANMTVDFGFYRVNIGNLTFTDVNADGDYDSGTDAPLFNALVQLFAEDDVTEIITGADGIVGTADDGFGPDGVAGGGDDGTGGVLTDASGNYQFIGLPEGNYIVKVTPPSGLITSTIDTAGTNDPDSNVDNDDNGIGTSTGQVSSGILTMTPGQGTGGNAGASNNTVSQATGSTTDPTVDFGFVVPVFSLGNRVWFDTDNSSTLNGSEVGINGVTVQLYAADAGGNPTGAVLQTDTTTNGGYYRFDNLPAGDYVVVIPASQFSGAGPLVGYWSSGTTIDLTGAVNETTAPDVDVDTDDNDDNGTRTTLAGFNGAVISAAVTLEATPSEPINDTDAESPNPPGEAVDNQSNRTVDFGFYRQTLSNLVFIDVNSDGDYDAGTDAPLAGATVQLYSSNGTEINVGPDGILGTSDDATGGVTTGAGGTYLFSGLPAGDYIVRVTPPVGYSSTVDTANGADTTDPDANIDNNDNGVGTASGPVSSGIVTLTPGSVGAANNTTVTNTNGTTANPTVDFGFLSNPGITKSVIDTDAPHTSGITDVAIGEIVTYEVVIDLPIGATFTNTTVTDQLDLGLAFVDCISVVVQGVDETATACPPAVAPAVGTSVNPADDGRQIVFTLSSPITVTLPSQQIVIQYRAIVLDVIENQDGVQLNNSVTWAWTGGSFTTTSPNVRIVEPDLDIDKSATPINNVPLGTPVQFTLFVDHTTPASQTDAFDVVVSDFLPANLQYVPCSATYAGLVPTSNTATCPAPATDLIFTWDVFPLGATATITFNAILLGTPAVNDASVAWTSLPIDPPLVGGPPLQLSAFNTESTERWYDPLDNVNVYGVSASVAINSPVAVVDDVDLPDNLPATGFVPNKITIVPEQPKEKAYTTTNVWLEIPSLGVSMPIEGVPLVKGDWDVSWLVQQAGWLQGTAFPSWQGNSVLTSHVTLADGTDGPFAQLGKLTWGDQVIVHAYGTKYTYEVRQNRTVSPYNTTVFEHEDEAWVTLITCKNYNETTGTYSSRSVVRAILIKSEAETAYFISEKIR
jgi:LPXTG-site transpeptidase (sortase) family protein